MTTSLDMPLHALREAAAEAAAKADEEARAAGLKPAGLVKRMRSPLEIAKLSLAKGSARGSPRVGTKRSGFSTGRAPARRKLGG